MGDWYRSIIVMFVVLAVGCATVPTPTIVETTTPSEEIVEIVEETPELSHPMTDEEETIEAAIREEPEGESLRVRDRRHISPTEILIGVIVGGVTLFLVGALTADFAR